MSKDGFAKFASLTHNVPGSRTARSYIAAIQILDDLFAKEEIFNLQGMSLTDISDPDFVEEIYFFIKTQERKYQKGEDSIFKFVPPTQTSYPRKYFCSAAMNCLSKYVSSKITAQVPQIIQSNPNKRDLIKSLNKLVGIKSTQTPSDVKQRIGQNVFREVILSIYESKCCLTGLEVPETLRASHITAWADDKKNRLNPENGLCLSATYDAAFDKHLISFDEDYRLILSPRIRDFYTSDAFKEYFRKMEGKNIDLPSRFSPNQVLLQKHREKLIV